MAVRADQYFWFNGVDEIVGAVVTSIFMYKKAYLI